MNSNLSSVSERALGKPVWSLLSLLAGALSTLAFSPFDYSWLVFLTLALVFYHWNDSSPRQAALSAGLFGLGLQGTGVSWLYYSVHVHGSAPVVFAILLVFLLCIYLSLYTALSAYVINRFLPANSLLRFMLFYPASWVLFEWLQGYVMTGFAWMQLGYTQIDMPLAGLAPVLGNHAIGGAIAVTAGMLAALVYYRNRLTLKRSLMIVLPVMLLWLSAGLLRGVHWTQPEGAPIRVSLIQGNIAQQDKWRAPMKRPTMDMYHRLTLAERDVDLIVWPETAIPDYYHRVQPYLQALKTELAATDTDLVLGIFVRDKDKGLLNSVIDLDGDVYHKRHLVPLGEYIPLRFLIEFFNQFVKIPMSDIASGDAEQPLLTAAGVPIGISICFEEAFARDVIRDLPAAKLLLNVSNDAWFEDSIEPHQHHTIARMRALEAGRYMIRSTNTGITSLIDPQGQVIQRLPQFETAVLTGEVQAMAGATPFVRWGDWLLVASCSLLLLGFAFRRSQR